MEVLYILHAQDFPLAIAWAVSPEARPLNHVGQKLLTNSKCSSATAMLTSASSDPFAKLAVQQQPSQVATVLALSSYEASGRFTHAYDLGDC